MKRLACLAIALFGLSLQTALRAEEDGLNWQKPVVVSSQPKSQAIAELVRGTFAQPDAVLEVERVVKPASYEPSDAFVVRAQNQTFQGTQPPYIEQPGVTSGQQPVQILPPQGSSSLQPSGGDIMGYPMTSPLQGGMGGPIPDTQMWGANGPQPYRFGWSAKLDSAYLAGENATDSTGVDRGDFQVTEVNFELRNTMPLPNQWIFSLAGIYGLRLWEGPQGPGAVPLPGQAHRAGLDLALTTPSQGPFTAEFGFTPALATDFDRSLDSQSWQFDGRGALFIRTSPQAMWVLGAVYWDRVHDKILPWAGLVWNPNDRWEIRAVVPNPQVSYFLGTPNGVPTWLYVAGEFHMESYQIATGTPLGRDQVEIEDWRVALGLRTENCGVSTFVEGGYIFNRTINYRYSTQHLEIGDGFMARAGIKF